MAKKTAGKRAVRESALYDRVVESIGLRRDVEERKMFGALAFVVDGKLCCSVKGNRIMVRVDPALHEASLKKAGCRPLTMSGHTYPGWLIVQDSALRTKSQLDYWIGLALEYNPRAPASKQRSRKRTAPSAVRRTFF
jgi:TfoX/Sxy family transcriptional regulator of competence genes